jgi:putative transposase
MPAIPPPRFISGRHPPRGNGFAESFNGRFHDEFLNTELFTTAPEAQILADRWRLEYITLRWDSAL